VLSLCSNYWTEMFRSSVKSCRTARTASLRSVSCITNSFTQKTQYREAIAAPGPPSC
jgi:hypothetical protein